MVEHCLYSSSSIFFLVCNCSSHLFVETGGKNYYEFITLFIFFNTLIETCSVPICKCWYSVMVFSKINIFENRLFGLREKQIDHSLNNNASFMRMNQAFLHLVKHTNLEQIFGFCWQDFFINCLAIMENKSEVSFIRTQRLFASLRINAGFSNFF